MFNSSILDVAVGVAFVFLLVSVLCSAVREAIEHVLKTRASYLEYAIREMLADLQGNALAKDLFDHPMISGLYPGKYQARSAKRPRWWVHGHGLPSYIPSRAFALALIDMAARGPKVGAGKPSSAATTISTLRESVMKMENPSVQRVMLLALDSAQDSLDQVRQNLEHWYDGVMDRVSGWYKRSTQAIVFTIAILVAVLANVDAIEIASGLYRNPSLRDVAVSAAEKLSQDSTEEPSVPTSAIMAYQSLLDMQLPIGWERDAKANVNAANADAANTNTTNTNAANANAPNPSKAESISKEVQKHWLGWLLTAFAATLGAPFWFDVLNKVMVIRSTVKPHEKSGEEGSKDRLTPQHLVVSMPAAARVSEQPQDEDDDDACSTPITDITRDEDLPPARGGVQS